MNTTVTAVDQVREQARALYKQIEAASSKNRDDVRGELKNLAESLRKAHLDKAATLVESAPNDIDEMRERVRETLQSISQAVATARSKSKQRA